MPPLLDRQVYNGSMAAHESLAELRRAVRQLAELLEEFPEDAVILDQAYAAYCVRRTFGDLKYAKERKEGLHMVMEADDPGKSDDMDADVSIEETQRRIDATMGRLDQRPEPGPPLFPGSR